MLPTSHRDLMGACLWALAAVLAVLFFDDTLIRIIVCAPLLLFLTGHAALRALGPIGGSPPERVVYAVGASIAICLVGGFLLNWIGYLTPLGWVLWLAAATGLATAIALHRHPNPVAVPEPKGQPGFPIWHAPVLGIAILITYGAYGLAVRDEAHQRQFKYTELWMLPGAPAAPDNLVIGIKSAEAGLRHFDVEVRLDGTTVALWRSIAVEPGATWTREMAVAPHGARPHKAEALLYEPVGNALYRRVSTVIPGA
jgi:hypothetical protein